MEIVEPDTLIVEQIHVRRIEMWMTVAGDVAVALVVSKDKIIFGLSLVF